MPSLTSDQIAKLWLLKGQSTACEAAKAIPCSPETVRRLWRGETHREVGASRATGPEIEASLGKMLEELGKKEEKHDDKS